MKWQRLIFLALAVAAAPLTGVTSTTTPPAPEAPPAATAPDDSLSRISPPVLGLVKMVNSGVSQDVINAYLQNSPTPFSLTPDDIIRLQGLGVSASLMTTMLNHDKSLRDNPHLAGPPAPGTPAPAVTAPYTPSDSDVYNNLAPYGYWGDLPGYGAYWQPYGTLAYSYYPWSWLSYGYWWNYPGHGWCWFPHSHYNYNHYGTHGSFSFYHVNGTHSSLAFNHANATRTTTGFHTGAATVGGGARVQNNRWVTSFNGGFHGSTGSGFHTGGSSTFHGGTGGGSFHGGGGSFHGGGGGFHGGGGGSHGGGHR